MREAVNVLLAQGHPLVVKFYGAVQPAGNMAEKLVFAFHRGGNLQSFAQR